MRGYVPLARSAQTLIGNHVRNSWGEDLGTIEDLVLDLQTGRTVYAIMAFRGLLGIGHKLLAVPFQAMTVDTADGCFVLRVDKDRLRNAPGFERDNWPEHVDPSFVDQVYGYYGVSAIP